MPEKANPMSDLLEQAMSNYQQAVQTSLKMQEEGARWWMGIWSQAGVPEEWKKRMTGLSNETIPVMQKRVEESVRLVEQAGRVSLDLWKQAVDWQKAEPLGVHQSKVQELWQASLEVVRDNAKAAAQVNGKLWDAWMHFVPRAPEGPPPKRA